MDLISFDPYIKTIILIFRHMDLYGMPNTSEVTSSFVDNQKFVLLIRITLLIMLKYKMFSQISKVVTLTTNNLNLDI